MKDTHNDELVISPESMSWLHQKISSGQIPEAVRAPEHFMSEELARELLESLPMQKERK